MSQENTSPTERPAIAGLVPADFEVLGRRAAEYAAEANGQGTRAAYRSAWRTYSVWCAAQRRDPLSGDPGLVALYLTQRADEGLTLSSLQVARAAIRAAHRLAGVVLDLEDPRFCMVMEGIARHQAGRSRRQASPAVPDVLRCLLDALPDPITPKAAAPALLSRNRALLLIGFGAALRRSEIVALQVGDVTVTEGRGLLVRIRRGKTDQRGEGRTLAICANLTDPGFCAMVAFKAWRAFRLEATPEAPLFCGVTRAGGFKDQPMADKIVNRLLKDAAKRAGLDSEKFSGHSLRRGLLTAAGDLQLPLVDLMRQSRHQSVQTALSYIEAADAWRNNITGQVFGAG